MGQFKGNVKWHGVGITHDLTIIEYAEEKFRESHLRLDTDERNNRLSSDEKMLKFWKVVGGRGKRHLTLHHLSTCNYSNSNMMEMKEEKVKEEEKKEEQEEVDELEEDDEEDDGEAEEEEKGGGDDEENEDTLLKIAEKNAVKK